MADLKYTSETKLRAAFWREYPNLTRVPGRTQNAYSVDIRVRWCDFIDDKQRDGEITEALASRATL